MKKRMIYICSLGLITAAISNADMRNDGALPVHAEENTVEDAYAGDSPENIEFSDSSEVSGPGEAGIQSAEGSEILFGSAGGNINADEDVNADGNVNADADVNININGASPEGSFEIDVYLDEEVLAVPSEKINQIHEDESVFPEPYGNRYIFLFNPEGGENWSLYFSQTVDAGDFRLYFYDAGNRMAKERIGAEEISMASDGTFPIDLDGNAEYVIILDHADQYPGIETSIFKMESVTPVPENEPENEPETEPGADTELSVALESAELVLDEGLEMLPAAMLPYLGDGEGAKALLRYSDGSEQILSGGSDSYGNSIGMTYEDSFEDDGSVSRTYTLEVMPAQSQEGPVTEKSETVVFRQQAGETIDDINAQEKTKVGFSGKKNWLLVQSVPQVTGKYSLKSFGRDLKELYYLADGEKEAVKAEDVFELKQGVTYTFLLILE